MTGRHPPKGPPLPPAARPRGRARPGWWRKKIAMTHEKRGIEKAAPITLSASSVLLGDLRGIIQETRQGVAATVNAALILLYWRVGKRISEEILQGGQAEYGEQILPQSRKNWCTTTAKVSVTPRSRRVKFSQASPDPKGL